MAKKAINPWYPRLHELYHQTPFRPFVIQTAGGKGVKIQSQNKIAFHPMHRKIHVATGGEISTLIDMNEVVDIIEKSPSRAGRTKR